MNKRAASTKLSLVMWMLVIFTCVGVFSSLFITDMAQSYDNEDMEDEWAALSLSSSGDNMYETLKANVSDMQNESESGAIGELSDSLGNIAITLKSAGAIVKMIFVAPTYLSGVIEDALATIGIPLVVSRLIGGILMITLWSLVIFGLIKLALRGSEI